MHRYHSIFFVGIKGAAMAHLAVILKKMGKTVTGVDSAEEFPTDSVLHDAQITVQSLEDGTMPDDVDMVVFSAAHGGSENKYVQQAVQRQITVLHQAAFLQLLSRQFRKSIAVAGCHGKTTTSSLLAYALTKIGAAPSYLIGTAQFSGLPGGDLQKKDLFVYEADEYGIDPPRNKTSKLLSFEPDLALVTNIDFDHPDVFTGLEQTKEVFSSFLNGVLHRSPKKGKLRPAVVCIDDDAVRSVVEDLLHDKIATYGFSDDAVYQIKHSATTENGSSFLLTYESEPLARFSIGLYGENNIRNTAGVIAILHQLGYSVENIVSSLSGFTGAQRRFQVLQTVADTVLIDDYAHHPHEITSVLDTARKRYPDRSITLIFQPHTYSRTQALKNELVKALSDADHAIIAPIFGSAREQSLTEAQITPSALQGIAVKKMVQNVVGADDEESFLELLSATLKPGGVVLLAGAGNIYQYEEIVATILQENS